jgi:hypothetical protein
MADTSHGCLNMADSTWLTQYGWLNQVCFVLWLFNFLMRPFQSDGPHRPERPYRKWMPMLWTFADLNTKCWTFSDLGWHLSMERLCWETATL